MLKKFFTTIILLFLCVSFTSCSAFNSLFGSHAKKSKVKQADVIEDDILSGNECFCTKEQDNRPYAEMTDDELIYLFENDPKPLGSLSLGYINSGALMHGIQMPEDNKWKIINAEESWGTQETIKFITTAINTVHKDFPNTQKLYIGDISDKDGGHLGRHLSHQAGRDADLGWYYTNNTYPWWTRGTKKTMDLDRTWGLIRAFMANTDVELIIIDKSIQKILYEHALKIGEDKNWLDAVFQYPKYAPNAIIRHAKNHKTHMHVRFYNCRAQELGRRLYSYLIDKKIVNPPLRYVYHKVRSGQTLGHLATKYGTSISSIKRANGLRSNLIRAGKSYRIPKHGGVKPILEPFIVPERIIPPKTVTLTRNTSTDT